jgi:hypothetical protein
MIYSFKFKGQFLSATHTRATRLAAAIFKPDTVSGTAAQPSGYLLPAKRYLATR